LPWKWIKERVYPERLQKSKEASYRNIMSMWWRHWNARPGLYHAIGRGCHFAQHPSAQLHDTPMERVIALTRVSKYLNAAVVSNSSIFTLDLFVFATADLADLALLQSNVFVAWAWSRGGRMKHDLRFSGSDVFETFPMPSGPLTDGIRRLGQRFHETRELLLREYGVGLTKITNLVHDPEVNGNAINTLRKIWCDIDREVVGVYGWSDLDLNHGFHEVEYRPETDRLRFTISETARFEILRRLSELNRQRHEEEVFQGMHGSSGTRAPRAAATALVEPSLDFESRVAATGNGATPSATIISFLSTHDGWHAKADVLAATGITEGQWNVTIADLISGGRVERQGEKRGARYRLVGSKP
jgi:hypothetical protein